MTASAWRQALDSLVVLVTSLAARGIHLGHVNLGGGLPGHGYLDRDGVPLVPPTGEIFAAIREGMGRLREASGRLRFLVEPGRHLVADHGTIRAHVARLTSRDRRWVYLSCGKFNGLYETDQLRYRLTFPGRAGGAGVPAVVAGPTCDSDDSFGGGPVTVPADLASGDPVWIHSAGAYAIGYTTVGFNGFRPLPVRRLSKSLGPEDHVWTILLSRCIRRRESYTLSVATKSVSSSARIPRISGQAVALRATPTALAIPGTVVNTSM